MKYLYIFWGKVIMGHKRGKSFGFPTANIRLHKNIPEGIYISQTFFNGNPYCSVSFIGSAKTFGEKDYKAETYILDFNDNIYGKWNTVFLLKKIRENKKFASEKELIEQMKEDIKISKHFFKKKSD